MRALVTGVSGFVGGHLAEHLVAQGDLVVGLSASGRWPAELAHLGKTVRIEAFNLVEKDEDELAELVRRKQPEVIYHLAAQSNPQGSLTDPRHTWTLNLVGSLNLLEAVKSSGQKPRVILVGSGVSYGNPTPEFIPVREDCPLRPNNPYAASKASVDLLGIQHYLAHGTDVVMVRPFNHAGPRQSSRYVLAALAVQVAEVESGRRDCLEVGNLDVVRDFTDVRDVVRAYRLLAQAECRARSTTSAAAGAPRSLTLSSTCGRWRKHQSRSESIRGESAPSICPFWSPTLPSSATPSAGHPASPLSRPWPTCLTSAARRLDRLVGPT